MGRLLKILLSIFATIILLIVIAVVVLPMVIDPNDYKPEIQSAVKDNLGRDLTIEGDLDLSVFPWIGISTGKLVLSNAPGFTDNPFAEIEESNIKVKLFPLFSKQFEVSRIVLKGLVLNLAKNKQGVSNWDDLSAAKKTKTAEKTQPSNQSSSGSPLAALAIGGIDIEKAHIVWDDQQQGKYTEINDFNLNTDALSFNEEMAIALSMHIVNKQPALTESVKLATGLVINEQMNVFKLNNLDITSISKGKAIPGNEITITLATDVAVDLPKQTLNVSGLKLNSGNLHLTSDISGTNITSNAVFKGPINIAEFNLAAFLKSLGIPLPKMQDANALNSVGLSFNLLATAHSAAIQKLSLKLDETQITGSSSIKNFSKPAIDFIFNVDAIDVDRYLAPAKDKKPGKTATPAAAVAATAGLFPVKTLRKLNVNGSMNVGSLKVNKLKMQGINLTLQARNGVLKTRQIIKQFYQGAYNGNSTINVKHRTPMLSLNEKLSNVQIEPLLNDMLGVARMTGTVNVAANINGRGNTIKTIKSSLNGNLNFNFKNGLIRGFNLQKIIDSGKALLKGGMLPTNSKNDQTVFSVISGTANINNGLVINDDLYAEASKLRVNGKGTANLATDKLNYSVKAKLLKAAATATEPEKIKGMPVIIKVGGTLSKPSYQLDVTNMLLEKNKEKINKKKDELLKKLDEKLAPGVGNMIKGFF